VSSLHGFDRIIGQDAARQVLLKAVHAAEPAHAYLFLGLAGTGKTKTALEFAKALDCENPTETGACEECAICKAIEHGNFPDIRLWSPKGRDTTIENMREMRDLASFKPMRGKWVVNVVERADTLNEDSANCILKLLEEPPSYVINILLYRNAANILPTIRSRCQLVRFEQVNNDLLAARLVEEHDLSQEEAEFLASYSQGRPGMAIGLIDNNEFQQKRNSAALVAAACATNNPWAALGLADALRSGGGPKPSDAESEGDEDEEPAQTRGAGRRKGVRDASLEALDTLVVWYRDLLAIKMQGGDAPIVNCDKRAEIAAQSASYSDASPLLAGVEAILHTKRCIQGNANPQIATEALMMQLCS